MTLEQFVSTGIFLVSLYFIFSEKLNRTIASAVGAAAIVGAGIAMGFYSEEQAIEAVDFETIGLLMGMMVLVAILQPTGFFQYLAVLAGKVSQGRPVRLLLLLGGITTVLSMFLDNVTTVVLIAPVTILMSEILGISATPFLMAEALLSDTGGVATLVGDPPNVLIATSANFTFIDFLTHALPVVVIAWASAMVLLRILFHRELDAPVPNQEAVMSFVPMEALKDWLTARKVIVVVILAIIFFLLEDIIGISPAFVALAAAAVALVWVRPDVNETLKHVEWSVLVFFASLFIIVGGLEASGTLHLVTKLLILGDGFSPQILSIIFIWAVAVMSAVVDNVPITIALIPVIVELGTNGLNTTPLYWALVFGAGFGGNATIIGSSANIVVASLSERTHDPITSRLWSKRGLPVMLVTCVLASLFFLLAYPLFSY